MDTNLSCELGICMRTMSMNIAYGKKEGVEYAIPHNSSLVYNSLFSWSWWSGAEKTWSWWSGAVFIKLECSQTGPKSDFLCSNSCVPNRSSYVFFIFSFLLFFCQNIQTTFLHIFSIPWIQKPSMSCETSILISSNLNHLIDLAPFLLQ